MPGLCRVLGLFSDARALVAVLLLPFAQTAFAETSPRADGPSFATRVMEFSGYVRPRRKLPSSWGPNTIWLRRESPWFPYLKRPFSDGLNARQRQRYDALIKQGDCDKVLPLERLGFLSLYPELEQDLATPFVAKLFATVIVPFRSIPHRRCVAIKELEPWIERSQKNGWPEARARAADWIEQGRKRRPAFSEVRELAGAIVKLERLAICVHDIPSMRFILQNARPLLYFEATGIHSVYLTQLARALGMGVEKFDQLSESDSRFLLPDEAATIRSVFSRMSAEEASHYLPYRKTACAIAALPQP